MSMRYRLKLAFQVSVLAATAVFSVACPRPEQYTPVRLVYEYDPATDTWTEKAPVVRPRLFGLCQECAGEIYLIGGRTGIDGDRERPYVDRYDPAGDEWSIRKDIPVAAVEGNSISCCVNGRIYVAGSYVEEHGKPVQIPVMFEYDPATDVWSEKAQIPETISRGECFVIGDEICIVYLDSPYDYRYDGAPAPPVMFKYNTVTDTWISCAPPAGYPLVTAGGKIYAIGTWDPVTYDYLSLVYEYEPASGAWMQKSSKPSTTLPKMVVECAGKIFVICDGGEPVEEYDPAADTWATRSDVPVPADQYSWPLRAFAVTNKIYLFFEEGEVAEYDPASDTWAWKSRFPGPMGVYDRFDHWDTYYYETANRVVAGGRIYMIGGYAEY